MRLLQLSVPDETCDAVRDVLDDEGIGYTVAEGDGAREGEHLVSFVVPADAVEHVLDDLQSVGYDESTFTVSLATEFANYHGLDSVQTRWANTPNRIAPETLRSKARDMRPNTHSYLWMMVLSTVVATAGLLIGSPAIVVGSMVLAPLVAPMLTASIGVVRDDRAMVVDSVNQQAVGLGVAVVGAVLFSFAVKELAVFPRPVDVTNVELLSVRLAPGLLAVPVGLAAGAAGSFGLATKGNVSIVGVMVAAALIPTAATAGIGFAWGIPVVGVGALVLLVLNVVAVNVGSAAMLWYLGYRPDEVDQELFSVAAAHRSLAMVAGGVAVLLVVAVALVAAGQHVAFGYAVNQATTDVLSDDAYSSLELSGLTAQYAGYNPFGSGTKVTVTLSRTSDRSYPALPNELDRAITSRSGENVTVQVQYQDYQVSNATRPRAASRVPAVAATGR